MTLAVYTPKPTPVADDVTLVPTRVKTAIPELDALLEAGDLYGDDQERALADLLAGKHPLQRSSSTPG